MTFLQTGIYAFFYVVVTWAIFEVFGSDVHAPSQLAGFVFGVGLIELNKHYSRKRELAERKRVAEEYERLFGVKNEPEPDERGPE